MICKIHGVLEAVSGGSAQIAVDGGLTYEVLLPGFAAARLTGQVGEPVTLHTSHFLEGSAQGSSFVPRLAGFLTEEDRAFYQLFTTVKGIGPKKALRALSMSSGQIAAAITDRDAKLLQSLPEVGKRTAETIIATLHGRVDAFASSAAYGAPDMSGRTAAAPASSTARQALEVLLQLGENRSQAVIWIDEALRRNPDLTDPQDVITEVFNIKASV